MHFLAIILMKVTHFDLYFSLFFPQKGVMQQAQRQLILQSFSYYIRNKFILHIKVRFY